MKGLLRYSKQLESDFRSPSALYQSKMDLGISSLISGDFAMAKQMFDSAVEFDSLFPSAWIGKAFAEVALSPDESLNDLSIDEFLSRALKGSTDIINYKVAIAGFLAFRHTKLIKKQVQIVEEALRAKELAEKAKSRSISTAIIGGMIMGRDKSNSKNIIIGGNLEETFDGSIAKACYELHKTYPVSLIGMPNWDNFSVLYNKKTLPGLPVYYTTPFYTDKTDAFSKSLINAYNNKYKGKPSDMAYKGFESVYLFTKLLAKYPDSFMNHLSDKKIKVFCE